MDFKETAIYRIREFNRFYTVLLGTLDCHFLDSAFTLTEMRILFELYANPDCKAVDLGKLLRIDKGYLSRILQRFVRKGLMQKEIDPQQKRSNRLILTACGRKTVEEMILASNAQIAAMLAPLQPEECQEVVAAMDVITKYLAIPKKEE